MAGVRISQGEGGADRDAFVLSHPRGTVFHLAAWGRAVARTFGHRIGDLLAFRGNALTGVLPMARVSSILFGDRLVSVPFGVYGGPLAADDETEEALLGAATRQAASEAVRHVELRCRDAGPGQWVPRSLYATFRGVIAPTDPLLLAGLPKEIRRQVRAGLGQGLRPEAGFSGIGEFFDLFARGYRDHGTPVFPRAWFTALREELGDHCALFALRDPRSGRMAAGVFCLVFRDEVQPYYVGAAPDWIRRQVSHALYFELARWARDRGARVFDFGRSKKGTGSYDFKRRWGFAESDLDYRYHLVRDEAVPNLSPTNGRFRLAIDLWRHLPLPLARGLGPLLVRGIG